MLDENGKLYTNEDKYATFFAVIVGGTFNKYKLSVGIINQKVGYVQIPLSDIKEIWVFYESPYAFFAEIGYSELRRNLLQRQLWSLFKFIDEKLPDPDPDDLEAIVVTIRKSSCLDNIDTRSLAEKAGLE